MEVATRTHNTKIDKSQLLKLVQELCVLEGRGYLEVDDGVLVHTTTKYIGLVAFAVVNGGATISLTTKLTDDVRKAIEIKQNRIVLEVPASVGLAGLTNAFRKICEVYGGIVDAALC